MKALDYEDERVSSDVTTRLDEHAPNSLNLCLK
jgi:hypothetical protein